MREAYGDDRHQRAEEPTFLTDSLPLLLYAEVAYFC